MYRLVESSLPGTFPGTTIHVAQDGSGSRLLCLAVTSPDSDAIVQSVVEQFLHLSPNSALELHQFLDQVTQDLRSRGVGFSVISGLFLEERCIFCGSNGFVFLKRRAKVGKILVAEQDLKVIEGQFRSSDVFVFGLPAVEALLTSAQQSLTHFDQAQVFLDEIKQPMESLNKTMPVLVTHVSFTEATQLQQSSTPGDVSSPFQAVASQVTDTPLTPNYATQPLAPMGSGVSEVAFSQAPKKPLLRSVMEVLQQLPPQASILFQRLQLQFQRWKAGLFSNDVYVRQRNTKKIVRVVLPVLSVIIVVAGLFFVLHSRRVEQVKAAEMIIQPLDERLTQIKTTVTENPLQARTDTEALIVQLEDEVKKSENRKIMNAQLQKKLQEMRQFYDSISGMEELSALPTFFDLRLIQSDFIASKVDIFGNTMMFLDPGQKRVMALNIETKQATPLAIGELPKITDIVFNNRDLYLLGEGLYQFTIASAQSATRVRDNEDSLQDAQFLRTFNQNLYVLNKTKRNIFRYSFTDSDSLGDPVGWVRAGESVPFDDIQSMVIDSNIWLGTKTGEIKKMTTGRVVEFAVTGMKEPFSSPITVFTTEAAQNLYVLEPQKNRLVILTKNGEFLREVKSSTFASTTSVVADEALKKAFVVSGALVFEVGL